MMGPEMRRAEAVAEVQEVFSVHLRLLELSARFPELARRQAEIAEDLVGEALRELAVEPSHQRDPFLARDVARADLLCRVVGCAADPELHVRREVMEVVDLIVDAVIFAVGAGSSLR